MKFQRQIAKAVVTVAVVSLFAVPVMASTGRNSNDDLTPSFSNCQTAGGVRMDGQLMARGGNGNGGHGPGNGTGNGGNGPKNGTGNGPKTGGCVNL